MTLARLFNALVWRPSILAGLGPFGRAGADPVALYARMPPTMPNLTRVFVQL